MIIKSDEGGGFWLGGIKDCYQINTILQKEMVKRKKLKRKGI